jgi:hypothetical protein
VRVAIFSDSNLGELENSINRWMESRQVAEVVQITQTESSGSGQEAAIVTITILYHPGPEAPPVPPDKDYY